MSLCPSQSSLSFFPSLGLVRGCQNSGWVGDGYCDDGNNNADCNYDGGDCCGSNVSTQYCTECQCLE